MGGEAVRGLRIVLGIAVVAGVVANIAYHRGYRDGGSYALQNLDYVEVRPGVLAAWVQSGALR